MHYVTKKTADGERFGFGANWKKFVYILTEEHIRQSSHALANMLQTSYLEEKKFLDVGCGSGLSRLAARKRRAEVVSFNYDPDSVDCTTSLKTRYCSDDSLREIGEGSVFDRDYMRSLGKFDFVYS